ncbi:MAG: PspC domain-containing protein [Acidimicrobiales bacterium]
MDSPTEAGPTTGPPTPPPSGSPRPRELRRRPDQGHVAGVCAGVAEYFNIDPVIVRVAAVVLALSGPGLIAYALAWVFVPAAPSSTDPFSQAPSERHDRGAQILGIVLLAVAVSVLWGDWWSPARRWVFPLGLMAIGAWLVLRRDRDPDDATGTVPPSATPSGETSTTAYPWAPQARPDVTEVTNSSASDETAVDSGPHDDTALDAGPELPVEHTGAEAPAPAGTVAGWGGGQTPPPLAAGPTAFGPPPEVPDSVRAARRRKRLVFPIVMGALLLWTGIAFLAGVSLQTGLAVALCIVGVGFVLGAFVGGSKVLIAPALLVGAALVVTSVIDIPLSGPIGHRTWVPRTLAQVDERYEVSVGEGLIDLTGLNLDGGDRLDVRATVGIGHLVIEVPEGVLIEVTADVGAGETRIGPYQDNGLGVTSNRVLGAADTTGTIDLDLEVGVGQIDVIVDGTPASTATPR